MTHWRPTRRTILAGTAATAALALASPAIAQGRQKIAIGYQPLASGPLWVARGEGYFEEAGLDVEWIRFTSAIAQITALQGGQIQLGQGGPGAYLIGRLNGADVSWLSGFFDFNPLEALILRPESDVQDVAGLKGKKIAARIGTDGHFMLSTALSRAGLSIADVEMINLEAPNQVAAMKAGEIDAAYTWDPFVGQMVGFGARVLMRNTDLGLGIALGGWAANSSWVSADNSLAVKALTAVKMGYQALLDEPELAAKYTAQFTGMQAEAAESQSKAIKPISPTAMVEPDSPWYWGPDSEHRNMVNAWMAFAVENKLVKGTGDIDDYVKLGLQVQEAVKKA